MELQLTVSGKSKSGTVSVSDAAFTREFNENLVHQVVVAYLAGGRAGTKAQKNRSARSGGGSKPWRQKGTGRARAGTIRSPLWRKGGVIFAAQPRDFSQKVNKKMYKAAMQSIVSELVRQERLIVVDNFSVAEGKTKEVAAQLKGLNVEGALILVEAFDEKLLRAAQNLYRVDVQLATTVDPVSLIKFDKVIVTMPALKQLEERLA